jgi:hypothetical protein
VIEEDAVADEYFVSLTVIPHDVIGVHLGGGVGTLGLKERCLALGRWSSSEHLAGGGLLKFRLNAGLADRLQKPQRAQSCHISRVLRHFEAHPYMALGAKVINFIRFDIVDQVR